MSQASGSDDEKMVTALARIRNQRRGAERCSSVWVYCSLFFWREYGREDGKNRSGKRGEAVKFVTCLTGLQAEMCLRALAVMCLVQGKEIRAWDVGMRLMLMRQDRRPALPGQVYESEKDKWLWAEWELPHLRDGKRARGSARMDGQEG